MPGGRVGPLHFPFFEGMILPTQLPEISLRPLLDSDLPDLVRHADNPRVSDFLRDVFPAPYTAQDARDFLDSQPAGGLPRDLAITRHDELIGVMGYTPQKGIYRHSAEFGYWLAEPFWGRGITTAAALAFVPWVFERTLVIRLYAHVFANNPASIRVLEKAGFQQEGIARKGVIKHDQVLDEIHFARIRTA